ncbi:MAG: pyridoxamine 5'-phosphate oxidase [Saprospiraceae bacterium]|nr:pyridoxamine 5'-phosphate oxidase [Saprospiraceae bacterium]
MSHIADLRKEYQKHFLSEDEVSEDPFYQFGQWFLQATNAFVNEPNAFTLATVNHEGIPSARVLLLKGVDDKGFVFYTNYGSAKSKDMAENPHVAMVFLWHELERQVRIKGTVSKVPREESELYFHSRPRESQMGAWVSPQSKEISSRSVLDKTMEEVIMRYKDVDVIPLPDYWGGYRVIPNEIEFWQGRPNRLHDRLRYTNNQTNWKITRLAP